MKVGGNVIRVPMINSVGIEPVFGAQVGEAKLCASCHTIVLPVYDAKGRQVKTDFEQTTYFEWLNSSFASANTNRARTAICPTISRAEAGVPNRQYRGRRFPGGTGDRHTYKFAASTNWFSRHVRSMGVISSTASTSSHSICSISSGPFWGYTRQMDCYPTPCGVPITASKMRLMERSLQAQSSAQVSFDSVTINGGQLQADVRVKNLVGHKFPSGVSFRRAFLDFQVLDGQNHVLWESGGTNAKGVITDTPGKPLGTEFFSPASRPINHTSGQAIQSPAINRFRSTRRWCAILRDS